MPTVAFYSVYRDLNPNLTKFLQKQAARNASVAIAIDVQLYRPSTRKRPLIRSIASTIVENTRHLNWLACETLRGHLIIPTPAIVRLIYCFRYVLLRKPKPRLPHPTAVDLYRAGWPTLDLAQELMATYLRFVAQENELYGLNQYTDKYIQLYIYAQLYSRVISWIFRIANPAAYISIYSGYLQHFIPCHQASKVGSPVLVMGCSDCLYRVDDSSVPRQFIHLTCNDDRMGESYEQLVFKGQNILRNRIRGKLDHAIEYMPSSPFMAVDSKEFWCIPIVLEHLYEYRPQIERNPATTDDGFIVIYMHELQDWHHNGVLPPFASSYYEWLYITIRHLLHCKLPFVIKIHPAIVTTPKRYKQSVEAICQMSKRFNAKLPVATGSTTLKLVEMGMELGLTVRGTVALELAFLNSAFLCAGNPPYGALFPRRLELDLTRYLYRLENFRDEPMISSEESAAASFYIGLQDSMATKPDIRLQKRTLSTSQDSEFIVAKNYL